MKVEKYEKCNKMSFTEKYIGNIIIILKFCHVAEKVTYKQYYIISIYLTKSLRTFRFI